MPGRDDYGRYIDTLNGSKPCHFCSRMKKLGRGRRQDEPYTGIVPESSCEAFPDGIPSLIFNGFWDHTKPYKGDGGKMFLNEKILTLDGKCYRVGWRGLPIPE